VEYFSPKTNETMEETTITITIVDVCDADVGQASSCVWHLCADILSDGTVFDLRREVPVVASIEQCATGNSNPRLSSGFVRTEIVPLS